MKKTILEGFQWYGNFVLQEIGSRHALHYVGNGPSIDIHREVKQEVTINLIGQKGRIWSNVNSR